MNYYIITDLAAPLVQSCSETLFTLFSNELICPNDVSNQIALFFFLFLQLTHRKHLTRLHYFFIDAFYASCTSMMTLIIFKNALVTV